jgi:hypothetical protein
LRLAPPDRPTVASVGVCGRLGRHFVLCLSTNRRDPSSESNSATLALTLLVVFLCGVLQLTETSFLYEWWICVQVLAKLLIVCCKTQKTPLRDHFLVPSIIDQRTKGTGRSGQVWNTCSSTFYVVRCRAPLVHSDSNQQMSTQNKRSACDEGQACPPTDTGHPQTSAPPSPEDEETAHAKKVSFASFLKHFVFVS